MAGRASGWRNAFAVERPGGPDGWDAEAETLSGHDVQTGGRNVGGRDAHGEDESGAGDSLRRRMAWNATMDRGKRPGPELDALMPEPARVRPEPIVASRRRRTSAAASRLAPLLVGVAPVAGSSVPFVVDRADVELRMCWGNQ